MILPWFYQANLVTRSSYSKNNKISLKICTLQLSQPVQLLKFKEGSLSNNIVALQNIWYSPFFLLYDDMIGKSK